jgi:hypothetical protein
MEDWTCRSGTSRSLQGTRYFYDRFERSEGPARKPAGMSGAPAELPLVRISPT